MGTLAEYKRKTPLFDGKPKVRVWVVERVLGDGVMFTIALFTSEERAVAYAERFPKGVRVTRWLTDSADERIREDREDFMKALRSEEE